MRWVADSIGKNKSVEWTDRLGYRWPLSIQVTRSGSTGGQASAPSPPQAAGREGIIGELCTTESLTHLHTAGQSENGLPERSCNFAT